MLALAALGVGFTALLAAVFDTEVVAAVDEAVNAFLAAHRTPAATDAFLTVTTVGGAMVRTWPAAAMTALVAWQLRSWRPVWVAVVALTGVQLFVFAIKQLMERPRPDVALAAAQANGFSYPSGHTAGSLVAFGLLAWLTTLLVTRRAVVVAVWAVAATLSAAVGVSRLYLGVHYLSDVLGGWALGAAWLAIVLVAATGSPIGARKSVGPVIRSGAPGEALHPTECGSRGVDEGADDGLGPDEDRGTVRSR